MNNNINEILKTIFEKALELDKDRREEYFESLSENQKIYIDEVKSLITSYETTDDFLEIASTDKLIFSQDKNQPNPMIGKHIGSYLIEGEVGFGGMGVVLIGKRDDKEFEQKVAIKILKQGLSTKYLVKRFETERQILANLQHPNITKLFDGGKTEDGLPYLVMEFIEGIPITDYCCENNLSIRERLKLFTTICSAVQYAHQNLIIHRDIKPANILVNTQGRPKLLDFGIAKLLDETIMLGNAELTQTKMWHLTPEYASPEQILGENITTSSDIYSLGVLLYKLLTGCQPYKITNNSPLVISKIITEDKIIKPSEIQKTKDSASNPEVRKENNAKISNMLKGDLDNIILKAMRKDPAQRYRSAQEFIDDIDRYLNGLPVTARQDTISYRFSKFVKRHKVGVTLFLLFNILVFLSIAAIIYQGKIAAEERDKAKIENKKFEKVNSFLQQMLSSVDPSEIGRDVKVYDILAKAANDVETELSDQPEIEASIRSTLGNTYVNLGEYDKGKPFLDKALSINEKIFGKESEQTAQSLHDLALYYDWVGDYKIADSLYSKSIEIFRKVLKEPTERFADALNDYAITTMNFGYYEKADKLYNEAIDIALSLYGEKNRNTAVFMNNLALNSLDAGNFDEAEKYFKKSLAIIIELLGENRPEVGSNYNNLAYLYVIKKEYKLAEEYLQKSYQLKLALKGKDHSDVGLALNNLGVVNIRMGNYAEAEKYLLDGVKQYRKTLDPDHPYVALSQYWLGKVYLETEHFDKAEDYLRKSLKTRIKKLPEDNKDIWRSKTELGICLFKNKKYNEAETVLLPTLEYYKSNFSNDNDQITRLYNNIIKLYKTTGNKIKAKKYSEQLISFHKENNSK
ncbi:Adenylate cyclase [hydrothermal vent metagenome]|uniref:Adenylate cyclase n=1 Tax=hydrothermal vent metagenome TaxID=652676 RepID=A0A3B1BPT6_9ZZZZ